MSAVSAAGVAVPVALPASSAVLPATIVPITARVSCICLPSALPPFTSVDTALARVASYLRCVHRPHSFLLLNSSERTVSEPLLAKHTLELSFPGQPDTQQRTHRVCWLSSVS